MKKKIKLPPPEHVSRLQIIFQLPSGTDDHTMIRRYLERARVAAGHVSTNARADGAPYFSGIFTWGKGFDLAHHDPDPCNYEGAVFTGWMIGGRSQSIGDPPMVRAIENFVGQVWEELQLTKPVLLLWDNTLHTIRVD